MNSRPRLFLSFFPPRNDIPACRIIFLLLKITIGAAGTPSQQRRSFNFTSLFERWLISTHSQAGVFLLRLIGGSRDPIPSGVGPSKPQDAEFIKSNKMTRLAVVA
jgi:hypothetical protein